MSAKYRLRQYSTRRDTNYINTAKKPASFRVQKRLTPRQHRATIFCKLRRKRRHPWSIDELLENQHTLGNRATNRMLARTYDRSSSIQAYRGGIGTGTNLRTQVKITPIGSPSTIQRGWWSKFKKSVKKAWGKVKGGVKKAWGGVKKGVKKVWGGLKKGASKVWGRLKSWGSKAWSWITKGAKKAWRYIKKGVKAVWTGLKWVGKQLWSKLKAIYKRAVYWIKQLPTRLKRLFKHIWKGVKSLKPWSLKWWKSLGKASTWKGFLKWLGISLIYILEAAGVGEIYETIVDFIKFNTRPLKGSEIAKARVVFGNAIDYSMVRVDQYALIGPSWTKRAYVSFHTINAWGPMSDHTLIHELTHVWQYRQMGAIYMPKALHAQKAGGYRYGGLPELRRRMAAGQGFTSFNLEQQGEILGDYYVDLTSGSLSAADLAVYEYFVNQVRR